MLRRRLRRPSAALVISIIALVLSMAGTSWAALVITGAHIRDGSVGSADIANGSLRGIDVRNGSLGSADVANGSIGGIDVRNGSVGSADIANGSLRGIDVRDGTIGLPDLGTDVVDSIDEPGIAAAAGSVTQQMMSINTGDERNPGNGKKLVGTLLEVDEPSLVLIDASGSLRVASSTTIWCTAALRRVEAGVLSTTPVFAGTSVHVFHAAGSESIGIVGNVRRLEPGTWDVQLQCLTYGTSAHYSFPAVNAIAVPIAE